MRSKLFFPVWIAVMVTLLTGAQARAELHRIFFDVCTMNTWVGNPAELTKTMSFWIEVYDTKFKNPPDFVNSITITAPNGHKVLITKVANWSYLDRGYAASLDAAALGADEFQPGTYTVAVTAGGVTLKATDVVDPLVFLGTPTVSYPTEGATGVPEQPTIKWSAAIGGDPVKVKAARYAIKLWNTTRSEPLYSTWYGVESIYTNTTHFTIPKGVLKPGCSYRLQIVARSNLQDTDSRSYSKWVNFATGSW
jgi:hypothetical protein